MGDFLQDIEPLKYRDFIVCDKHVHDEDLKSFIRSKGRQFGECSICGENYQDWSFDTPFLIDFTSLFKTINNCINTTYGYLEEILPYDSESGEWIGLHWSTWELINEEIEIQCDEALVDMIIKALGEDNFWAETGEHEESEFLIYTWETFSDLVKNKIRYLFYDFEDKENYRSLSRPVKILEEIGNYISGHKMFVRFPLNEDLFNQSPLLYRARQHSDIKEVTSSENICSPPPQHAKSNRFSPEGISMFYGGECPITAIKEVLEERKSEDFLSVAEFTCNKPLTLVDLRNPKTFGFFDENNIHNRQASIFIKRFVEEITKPVDYRKQKDSIEYIPSQIITEYFRYVLTKKGHRIDGIVYRSSKNPGKNCFVIFADSDSCAEEGSHQDNHLLLMKKDSIKTQKVEDYLRINS
ncbi:HEPN-associated N-terminal domain-containing protein [Fontibacter flavus]|uniref:HEPN-associated N-terminal domain-containing protein n=1 Tax=Fontibacter flavus TaxID=654838 RepID=A0ABV6FVC9_9BACT